MSKTKKDETVERKIEAICVPCPDPCILEIDSKNQFFDPSEFNQAQLVNSIDQFNSNQKDRKFLHTYIWKPKHNCCQVLKAHIQVKMTSLAAAHSLTSATSGNDGISLLKNGGTKIIPSESVYSNSTFPIAKGEEVIKSFVLTGSELDWLNSAHKLSIYVQDDTSVNWIRIRLEICCLKNKKREDKEKA